MRAKRDVDAERTAVELARHPAFGSEAHAVVLHSFVLDLRMAIVGTKGKGHEVTKVTFAGRPESIEHGVRCARHPKVDVLRGSRALDPQLERKATFQRHGIAELQHDAS